ncbi:hypothetical protein GOODEAATRI_000093, partial [Goodea atripinnis]
KNLQGYFLTALSFGLFGTCCVAGDHGNCDRVVAVGRVEEGAAGNEREYLP